MILRKKITARCTDCREIRLLFAGLSSLVVFSNKHAGDQKRLGGEYNHAARPAHPHGPYTVSTVQRSLPTRSITPPATSRRHCRRQYSSVTMHWPPYTAEATTKFPPMRAEEPPGVHIGTSNLAENAVEGQADKEMMPTVEGAGKSTLKHNRKTQKPSRATQRSAQVRPLPWVFLRFKLAGARVLPQTVNVSLLFFFWMRLSSGGKRRERHSCI